MITHFSDSPSKRPEGKEHSHNRRPPLMVSILWMGRWQGPGFTFGTDEQQCLPSPSDHPLLRLPLWPLEKRVPSHFPPSSKETSSDWRDPDIRLDKAQEWITFPTHREQHWLAVFGTTCVLYFHPSYIDQCLSSFDGPELFGRLDNTECWDSSSDF